VTLDYSLLCPRPRKLEPRSGELTLTRLPRIQLEASLPPSDHELGMGSPAVQQLERALATLALPAVAADSVPVVLSLEPGDRTSEAYRLSIGEASIHVASSSLAGLFYGACTLAQLLRLGAQPAGVKLPLLEIADRPSFSRRGVMLDISRDKVPTLDTTLALVDLLASLKINELQLYMEHTFAYAGHERVWRDASPFTGAEIDELDRYCRARHVELVPNQNSFGHMQRWLAHEPYRSELAEAPNGFVHDWNPTREPYGLCPIEPRSLAFLQGLYEQLLPHFTSRTFNVGLDETFDLGLGRSAAACEERGTERVYLDFLQRIHQDLAQRGFAMQFWGDIIIKRPELIPELPRDAIALEWGYEHDHPFDEHVEKFAAAGLRFYVCPGTSSWNSIAGRTENALLNIAAAVKHGAAHGAYGVLNTDWGDNGHLQPLCVSYVGFLAGAATSWKAEDADAPLELPVAEWIDRLVLGEPASGLGAIARDLGNAYRELGCRPHNSSGLFYLVAGRPGQPLKLPGVEASHFAATLRYLERQDEQLRRAQPTGEEARRVHAELTWASDVLKTACRIGAARLAVGLDEPLSALAPARRAELAAELSALIERHRSLWLVRNRPGGLVDSVQQLQRVLDRLRTPAGSTTA
jgi:hypothetical protein